MKKAIMTRDQFIHETLVRSRKALSPVVAARYWELLGKAMGYIDAENQTNIAIFKDITVEAMQFLRAKRESATESIENK
jgi:hypothetical protein